MIPKTTLYYKRLMHGHSVSKKLIKDMWSKGASYSDIEQIFNIEIDVSNMSLTDQRSFIKDITQLDSVTWGNR